MEFHSESHIFLINRKFESEEIVVSTQTNFSFISLPCWIEFLDLTIPNDRVWFDFKASDWWILDRDATDLIYEIAVAYAYWPKAWFITNFHAKIQGNQPADY